MKKLITLVLITVIGMFVHEPDQSVAQTACPTPTGLTSTNITTSSAQLSWTLATTSSYSVLKYRLPGAVNWNSQTVQALPYTLQNLLCGATYEWRVQAVCFINGAQQSSAFSTSAFFTTLACTNSCPAPTNLTVSGITPSSAIFAWSSAVPNPASSYNLQYQASGGAPVVINNITAPQYQLGNLTCNTMYTVSVQSVCLNSATGTPTLSPWSAPVTFQTGACQNLCPAPGGLSSTNITASGVVLSWNAISPAPVGYNLRYRVASSLNWTVINNASNPYQLGNLLCNTHYEWQVQTICATSSGAASLSPWSVSATFTTAACPTSCVTPTGLTATNISANGAVLSWTGAPPPASSYQLRYRVSGTTTWTTISNASSPWQLGNLLCHTTYQWQVRSVCPATGTNTVSYSPWSLISSFTTLACPSPCVTPQGLTTTNITASGAQLSWTGSPAPAASYQVRYRKIGVLTWTTVNNATSPYQLSNLSCGSGYQWQVRAVCPASSPNTISYSPWSPQVTFTTAACPGGCPVPTNLQSTNITAGGAVLSWTISAPAPSYQLRYRISGTTTWTVVNNVSSPYQLGNLVCNTHYQWQVRSVCPTASTIHYSAWSVTASFTTLTCNNSACATPTGLTANVNSQGGLLSWNAVNGAISYNIRYRPANSNIYVNANSTSTFLQIGNLTPGTAYEWQVQAVCASPAGTVNQSAWSAPAFFTTPLLVTVYPNPASDRATISVNVDEAVNAVIEVRDMFGKVVYQEQRTMMNGEHEFDLNTTGFNEGWYSVVFNSKGLSTATRLFITK